MGKRIALNIFYNIALIIMGAILLWAVNHQHYALIAGIVFIVIMLVYLKIRLVKEVKQYVRNRK
ncbi:hypothetical protein GS399_02855 [Pedobacter sp. HMF7647]|uniref:Sortase n=1 Tax=Hufsiella arboris TaxID=2695275 RepID=A0A7K1Y5M4_9SPHI|nr:DUF6358 family protein [Hufsiella arboris]MXV49896.1 hypothetical protein [Hufsiella arboris]